MRIQYTVAFAIFVIPQTVVAATVSGSFFSTVDRDGSGAAVRNLFPDGTIVEGTFTYDTETAVEVDGGNLTVPGSASEKRYVAISPGNSFMLSFGDIETEGHSESFIGISIGNDADFFPPQPPVDELSFSFFGFGDGLEFEQVSVLVSDFGRSTPDSSIVSSVEIPVNISDVNLNSPGAELTGVARQSFPSPQTDLNLDVSEFTFEETISNANEPIVFNAPFLADQPNYLTQGTNQLPTHQGLLVNDLDFSLRGTDIAASAPGTVSFHENEQFGLYAIVDHGVSHLSSDERLFSVYAHLKSTNTALQGAYVEAGAIIGLQGNSGVSIPAPTPDDPERGTHVHFGVYSGTPSADPFDNPDAWTSVGIDGKNTIFRADVSGNGEVDTFSSPASFNPFVCSNFVEACRFYSLLDRNESVFSSGLISEGETYGYSYEADRFSAFDAVLTWPGSELLLNVYDPENILVASLSETDGEITYNFGGGKEGLWSFLVTGIETAPGGEPFSFTVAPVTPVPTPASGLLLLCGVFSLGLYRRKLIDW